jgi:hypothetical protein
LCWINKIFIIFYSFTEDGKFRNGEVRLKSLHIIPIDVGDMEWDHSEAVLRRVGGERKRVLPGHDRLVFQQERYPK